MKVAICYYSTKKKELDEIAKGIERGISEQGHQTMLVNMLTNESKLSMNKYFVIGCNTVSLFRGKLPKGFVNKLENMGSIGGKHCMAFVNKKMGKASTLLNLMNTIEKQGLFVDYSEILANYKDGYLLGKKLHIH